jgi:hypothetical protein
MILHRHKGCTHRISKPYACDLYIMRESCPSSILQAFLKKLAILPCPFFAAGFAFVLPDCLVGAGLSFLGSGSSSEKDSQIASSFVTGWDQFRGANARKDCLPR